MNKETIKQLRESLKMTQKQFAGEFGVSENTVWLWENGRRNPSKAAEIIMNQLKEAVTK